MHGTSQEDPFCRDDFTSVVPRRHTTDEEKVEGRISGSPRRTVNEEHQ